MENLKDVKKKTRTPVWAAIPVLVSLAGCAAAAVGGGAVGGIAYTDRGAKGDLKGNVSQVSDQAKHALKDLNIVVTESAMKDSGLEHQLEGKRGETDVSVTLTRASEGLTHVEVVARESTFKWNKDYAKQILAKIAKQ